MRLVRLWVQDYRNYESAELEPAPEGLTVIEGANGDGKTNLIEAAAYLATLSSFRGSPADALVRHGAERAVVRAEVEREGRKVLLEVELHAGGRQRTMMNRQPVRRGRDLLGALRVTVFSPDDLSLVKGGPAERRRYLDEALVALRPVNEALRADVERILRQRNALLKQAGSKRSNNQLSPEVVSTLDVWDAKLSDAGEALAAAREDLVVALEPQVTKAYGQLAAGRDDVSLAYRRSWQGSLSQALADAREDDLRRATTTVGPHRDELSLAIAGGSREVPVPLPARTHSSQGEQRCLALALRLGSHALVTDTTSSIPVLLLDDVFSELDGSRASALLASLPPGQALLTTAGPVPPGSSPVRTVCVRAGRLEAGKVC
ncbi:MAG TPA: DNA replication/repair protein RecF [Acidimicrobiales bacterium]|nr:DNA replication/repair protein RecF [Acidimicrobiales bacterium]